MASVAMAQRRDDELERYGVLVEPPDGSLQGLVELVALVCQVPTAAINIISRHHQQQIATVGIDPSVCARDSSMCAAVLEEDGPVVVPDASRDPRFAANAFVNGEIARVRFYASAPIITPDGIALGRLCVFDFVPRDLDAQQVQGLVTLAGQVMDLLELRFRSRALEESAGSLIATRDELRRSHQHLALFADQVSQDLRGPLTAIIAQAGRLAADPDVRGREPLESMVDAVSRAGDRMNRMIEEISGFALEGDRLRLAVTSIEDAVSLVLADLAPLVDESGAEIVVADLPMVTADADMLYSVVLTLLTNALTFVRPGLPPRIEVTAARTDRGWRFTVSDNGIGITPERRDTVFTRGTLEVDDHTGLPTTRRLVEAHGGRVGADAAAGGGAAVWFELPG